MVNLNIESYRILKNEAEAVSPSKDLDSCVRWYELTYKLFADSPMDSMNDFWRIVAYSYSWMPTIPTINSSLIEDPNELLTQLHLLKQGDSSNLSTLFKQLIPVINNSLIGTSKVLHFINPSAVPIIDSNVLRGYHIFFFKLYPEFHVPPLPAFKTPLNSKHISKYFLYFQLLKQWVACCDGEVSMRDIELGLFQLGKHTFKEYAKSLIYN